MGASTVGNIVTETVLVLYEELQPVYMPVPTEANFNEIANDFYKTWNFPNVVGAIDGKHVRINCPKNSGSMFFNYKKYFSVVLQAVVDANYRFITIDVGGYGKQSDGGTFQASSFYKALMTKQVKIPGPAFLPGTNIKAPHVFLGDEAYPLLDFLLKPYGGQSLPIAEECFNSRLSRARKTVECAFGMLNSKWRILTKPIETAVDTADNIIKCVCVLHNTILAREGLEHHLTDVEIVQIRNPRGVTGRPANSAAIARETFKTYFMNNPLNYM